MSSEKSVRAPDDKGERQLNRREEEREGSAMISAFSEGLYETLMEALERVTEDVRQRAEQFYSSPESRAVGAGERFRNEQKKAWDQAAAEEGLAYLRSQGEEYAAAYSDAVSGSFRDSVTSVSAFFLDSIRGAMSLAGIPRDERNELIREKEKSIGREEARLLSIVNEAVRRHWKPVHVLAGDYGEYGDCICYDEEFDIFFKLSPDDNYYHWGGYDLTVLSNSAVKRLLAGRAAVLRNKQPSPYRKDYLPSSVPPMIGVRIRQTAQDDAHENNQVTTPPVGEASASQDTETAGPGPAGRSADPEKDAFCPAEGSDAAAGPLDALPPIPGGGMGSGTGTGYRAPGRRSRLGGILSSILGRK